MTKLTSEEIKTILGINEIKDYKTLFRQLFAELLGTFLYLSIVLFAESNIGSNNVAIALANGLLVASIVQMIGHISGGHINPAVTIGACICGYIKVIRALLYFCVQILGAILGAFVAYAVSEQNTRGNLGATIPFEDLRADQVLGLEFLMTFILVAVFLSVVDEKRGARGLGSAPLAIGLSVAACQCSALKYSGSLNPIRSLGPAVVMNIWTIHWVFWVGPLLGGIAAGIIYRYFMCLVRNSDD